jgi:death-on-curing protein
MRYLILAQVLDLYRRVVKSSGGSLGVRDLAGLKAALAQPRMTFGGNDLYSGVADKAAALAFSLILNHPFIDGNKRLGHAAMETFLVLNGYELEASADEQESVLLRLAAGELERGAFVDWVRDHIRERRAS